MPTEMGSEGVEEALGRARSALRDEADRTRAGFHQVEDPGVQFMGNIKGGLDRLKDKFTFLHEYSDEFIKSTGVDVLIKAESTAKKMMEMDKSKRAEDKLVQNREALVSTLVEGGRDNRLEELHVGRVLPGATCSAARLWLHARKVMGPKGHVPLSTYDMASIGLGGCVTARGWVEVHDPSSPSLSIKMFMMGNCVMKKKEDKDQDFPDMEDVTELKMALRVLRGAMSFVHPWNRSVDALDNFLQQNNYCQKDLGGVERHVQLLSQFIDYVLSENAARWRGMEPFLDTKALRGTWEDYFGQKAGSFKKSATGGGQKGTPGMGGGQGGYQGGGGFKGGFDMPSNRYKVHPALFKDDICVLWNLGKCIKAPGTCATKAGLKLRHVCNWRHDMSKPHIPCGRDHMATLFHR